MLNERQPQHLPAATAGVAPPITAHHLFEGFQTEHKCDVVSITITFASQVSSDLSSGPTSKSDEFCDANVIVIEHQRCENTDFAAK